jgi:hypothetical protein
VLPSDAVDPLEEFEPQAVPMGDKSPKSKERQRKQDTAQKGQKKAAAVAKANPASARPPKGSK